MNDAAGKVTLEIGPVYTRVRMQGLTNFYQRELLNRLKLAMRASPEGAIWSPRHKRNGGTWDGYIKLFEYRSRRFPTGLLSLAENILEEVAEEMEFWCETADHRPVTFVRPVTADMLHGVMLRDYQVGAVNAIIEENGVLHMATNSGKTFVAAALCKAIVSNSLVLLHKKELLYQTADTLREATGLSVGLVGDGNREYGPHDITVAMVQTMSNDVKKSPVKFTKWFNTLGLFIIDECHHASARTMYELANLIPAPKRCGMSGTPLRREKLADLQLMGVTGPVRYCISNEQLIEEGHSAVPEITVVELPYGDLIQEKLDWQDAYRELIVENEQRNRIIVEQASEAMADGDVVLILVDRIEHQNVLHDTAFRDRALSMPVLANGNNSAQYRQDVLDDMRTGSPQIVCATDIFGEGVDVPAIDTVILAAGGKSHIRLLQRIGRGLRKKAGDNVVKVIDFDDRGNKHLIQHSEERMEIYTAEGFAVKRIPAVV